MQAAPELRILNIYDDSIYRVTKMKLSSGLQQIVDLEIELGNVVARIDEPAGTRSPLGVVFEKPLHLESLNVLPLPESVYYWESTDPHYEKERGYACRLTKHVVSGPFN